MARGGSTALAAIHTHGAERTDCNAFGMSASIALLQGMPPVGRLELVNCDHSADTTEWIKLISAQSNTVCEESSKKTISPEHVIEALKVGLSERIGGGTRPLSYL